MNRDTPIDCYEPQFTQREACELTEIDNLTINNWLQRGTWKLQRSSARVQSARRLFSVADIAGLHAMHFCVKLIELPPSTAAEVGKVVYDFFKPDPATLWSGTACIADCLSEDPLEVWHIFKKSYPFDCIGDRGGWGVEPIWRDRKTGKLHLYHPRWYPDEDEGGYLPHFPCILIPTSELAFRMFHACSEYLLAENPDEESSE